MATLTGGATPGSMSERVVASLLRTILLLVCFLAFALHVERGPDIGVWSALVAGAGFGRVDHGELALCTYRCLPDRADLTTRPDEGNASVRLTEDGAVASGRPSRIAAHLAATRDVDPEPDAVERALEDLETAVSHVRSTADGRYYIDERVTPTQA